MFVLLALHLLELLLFISLAQVNAIGAVCFLHSLLNCCGAFEKVSVTPRIYINILFLTLQQQGRLPNSLLCINKEAGRVQSNKIFRGRMFTGKPQHL
jgi:hypothetical protein